MKAITLTCDKYIKIADHMIHTYEKIWSVHPFTFRIPYEEYPQFLKDKYQDKVELFKLSQGIGKSIKLTVLSLLKELDDEEWIYWCMDDKYLLKLQTKEAEDIYQTVLKIIDSDVCIINLSRIGCMLKTKCLKPNATLKTLGGQTLLETRFTETTKLVDIWSHQFVRVKIIRRLFESFPEHLFKAKEMDGFPLEKKVGEKAYIPEKNLMIFGESTSRGELTENCSASFKKWRLERPANFPQSKVYIIKGEIPKQFLGKKIVLPKKLKGYVTDVTRWYWRNLR